jgi:hypothetical protein
MIDKEFFARIKKKKKKFLNLTFLILCLRLLMLSLTILILWRHSVKTRQTENRNVRSVPTICPSCGSNLRIKILSCPACKTEVNGSFPMGPFAHLSKEEESFLQCFLISRGNLKEVQERLNISYPTARNRLDHLLESIRTHVESEKTEQSFVEKVVDPAKIKSTLHEISDSFRKIKDTWKESSVDSQETLSKEDKDVLDILEQYDEGEIAFDDLLKKISDQGE